MRHVHPSMRISRPSAILIALIIVALLAGCQFFETPAPVATPTATPAPTETPVPDTAAPARWTIMIYMCGDNDLKEAALADFNEMEAAGGSTEAVKVVTQLSLPDEGTRRYLVEGDADFGQIASPPLADMGTRNMGNPQVLTDFVLWASAQFPAERYALIIWDHGLGWPASLLDQSAHDELNLPDLTQALNDARLAGGPQFLDVIGFDAGLMAQWEVFDAIAPYSDIAIASEEAVPATGWDYTAILAALRASPAMDGRALAEQITQVYISYYAINNPHPYVTLSAVKLADIQAVTDALNHLVETLSPALTRHVPAISLARSEAEAFTRHARRDQLRAIGSIDLQHFASLLATASDDEAVVDAARALANAVDDAVLLSAHDALSPGACGIAIHFPPESNHDLTGYTEEATVAGSSGWADLLSGYGNVIDAMPAISLEATDSVSHIASIHEPARIEFDLLGPEPETVWLLVSESRKDGTEQVKTVVSMAPKELQTTPARSEEPDIDMTEAGLSLSWNARIWEISDGLHDAPAVAWTAPGNPAYLVVAGEYRPQTGEPVEANLVFDSGAGRLEHIWAFRSHRGNLAPYEILPRQGDQFAIHEITLDRTGALHYDAGMTLTFGDPVTIMQEPASDGDYSLSICVFDRAGRVTLHQESWEVANKGLDEDLQGFVLPASDHRFLYPANWTPLALCATNQYCTTDESGKLKLTLSSLKRQAGVSATDFLREHLAMQREISAGKVSDAIPRQRQQAGMEIAWTDVTVQEPASDESESRHIATIYATEDIGYMIQLAGPEAATEELSDLLNELLDSWDTQQ